MATTAFDPVAYKQTTREQWQEAAEAWHRWGPDARAVARPGDGAHARPGPHRARARASSTWRPAPAARRSPRRVASARPGACSRPTSPPRSSPTPPMRPGRPVSRTSRSGRWTAKRSTLDDGTFDAVISRVGLIYFPDQQRALREIHRVLRPGGRLSAIVYSTADRNPFFSIPVTIIRRIAGLPAPAPGLPGPFSLGSPGVLEAAYADAGFEDVDVRPLDAPVRFPTAAECVRFERESFGALHAMLADVTAGRARPGVARDRGGAPAVREPRRIRRPLPAPHRKRPPRRLMRGAAAPSPSSWSARMSLPRIFLGSSGKQAKLLQAITHGLEGVADVEPWTTTFNPGRRTLDRLVELSQEVDFAAFVFAQDDWTTTRCVRRTARPRRATTWSSRRGCSAARSASGARSSSTRTARSCRPTCSG